MNISLVLRSVIRTISRTLVYYFVRNQIIQNVLVILKKKFHHYEINHPWEKSSVLHLQRNCVKHEIERLGLLWLSLLNGISNFIGYLIPKCCMKWMCIYIQVYIYIYERSFYPFQHIYIYINLAGCIESNPKALFSTATTPRCKWGEWSVIEYIYLLG